jgi:hypothetical protein
MGKKRKNRGGGGGNNNHHGGKGGGKKRPLWKKRPRYEKYWIEDCKETKGGVDGEEQQVALTVWITRCDLADNHPTNANSNHKNVKKPCNSNLSLDDDDAPAVAVAVSESVTQEPEQKQENQQLPLQEDTKCAAVLHQDIPSTSCVPPKEKEKEKEEDTSIVVAEEAAQHTNKVCGVTGEEKEATVPTIASSNNDEKKDEIEATRMDPSPLPVEKPAMKDSDDVEANKNKTTKIWIRLHASAKQKPEKVSIIRSQVDISILFRSCSIMSTLLELCLLYLVLLSLAFIFFF